VLGICDKGALHTLTNQAGHHRFGGVLDSPALNAKCNVPITRACKEDVIGSTLGIRSGTI